MKKIYCIAILFTVLLATGGSDVKAQQADYKYHTLFMYNFTRYIKWPDAALGSEFIIGVVGKSDITEHLNKMAQTKRVNGNPIIIKVFGSPDDITNCHMLFMPENYSHKFEEIHRKLANKNTLIISEKPGMAEKGSDVNFVIKNGRWNFEMNQASTNQHSLKVSSELTKFAEKIYTKTEI